MTALPVQFVVLCILAGISLWALQQFPTLDATVVKFIRIAVFVVLGRNLAVSQIANSTDTRPTVNCSRGESLVETSIVSTEMLLTVIPVAFSNADTFSDIATCSESCNCVR